MERLAAPRRAAVLLVAGLAVMALLGACTGSSSSTDSGGTQDTLSASMERPTPADVQTGGTLAFGLDTETTSGWDPANSQWGGSGTIVARAIFDRLMEIDENGTPQPSLAESITSNDDFTQWTIVVRSGITFQDGEPLDGAAVQANLQRVKTSVLLGAVFDRVQSVDLVDPMTVKVTVDQPWSVFPNAMATQAGTIAAPAQINSDAPAQHPIGTGPFTFKSWVPDGKLVVERNPNYWRQDDQGRQLPYLDRIEFSVLTDTTTRGASFDSGAINAFFTFEPELVKKYGEQAVAGKVQMITNADREPQVQILGLNTAKPPFDDPLARQLLAVSVDRQRISDQLYYGLYPPADSLFPASSPLYAETSYPSYDPAKAKELADQYQQKYGHPLQFSLSLPSTPQFRSIGEAAQQQADEYGIQIKLDLVDQSTLVANALTGNYEATGFITYGVPPVDQIFFDPSLVAPLGQLSLNFTRYSDPAIGDAFAAIAATDDRQTQIEQWAIVQERIAQDLMVIFVVRSRSAVVFANDVFGMSDATTVNGTPVDPGPYPYLGWAWKQS